MAAISQLKQMAIGVANHLQMRALDNADKAEGEVQIERAKLAYNCAIGFQAMVHGNFQCPRCWVAIEKQTVLTPIGGVRTTIICSSVIPAISKSLCWRRKRYSRPRDYPRDGRA
jgi:hypothetical protein